MTSSSIPTTFLSTNSMFGKYSADSMLMDFLPMQINASSTSLPVNTLDICCHLKASPWPHTKFKSSKIGQYHEKSRMFNLSLALLTSTHFIYRYSEITVPLMHLTHKGTPWHFSDECHFAFEALKKAFTTAPVLTHWILDTQITVKTDASDYTLTTVLSITTPDGELHPIAFHSQTLSALELNYNVHNKELLTIFEAFKQWQHYLKG